MPLIARERAQIVPLARGVVLEIGTGSGHNFPHFDAAKVNHLFALEPSPAMRKRAAARVASAAFPVDWLDLPGEDIPLADESVDTVLVTFTLCTIPDVETALAGMRRVLRRDGRLLFLEHGRAPDPGPAKWQDRLNSIWGKLAGGCHLNRDPLAMLRNAQFTVESVSQKYLKRAPKFAGFISGGVATR